MWLILVAYLALFIIPGITIFRLLNPSSKTNLEKFLLVVPLSLFYNYLTYLTLNYLGIPINQISLIVSIFFCILLSLLIKSPDLRNFSKPKKLPNLNLGQITFIIILLFALFLRIILTLGNIYPFSTDISNHLFYARKIVEFGSLPTYPDASFVVGEHIFLSYVPIFSGAPIIGYTPVLGLLIINILTILALYQLSRQISKSAFTQNFTLFLFSFLFLLGNSQLNFVFGGVVGNVLGYYLIASAILLTIMTYTKKSSSAAICLMANTMVLVYSHTMSPVIFLFIFLFSIISALLFDRRYALKLAKEILTEKKVILMALIILAMLFFHLPDYVTSHDPEAQGVIDFHFDSTYIQPFLDIANNSILKSSLDLFSLLALIGLILMFKRKDLTIEKYLLFFWLVIPTLYLVQTHLLVIDMPDYRVLNYIYYPTIFLASYAVGSILPMIKKRWIPVILMLGVVFLTLSYPVMTEKFSFPDYKDEKLNEAAFFYLNETLLPGENVFCDHSKSNIADQSIKNYIPFNNSVFFRDFWFRYELGENISTWNMMESPEKNIGLYKEMNIHYIILENNKEKYKQFQTPKLFVEVFENQKIIIYKINYPNQKSSSQI